MSISKNYKNAKSVLTLTHVSKDYELDGLKIKAVDDVSIDIKEGELVAVIGPSGSGKSTLMHIMGLLDRQSAGQVWLNGHDVSHLTETQAARLRNKYIGFIFQQFNLLARASALENVLLPTIYNEGETAELRSRAVELMTDLGLGDRLKNSPSQLSGGQQQRVAIARALINDPKIIFADEPTGNLDSRSGHEVVEILKDLHQSGRTIVIVTHDPELAQAAERIISIYDGKVISDTAGSKKSVKAKKGAQSK